MPWRFFSRTSLNTDYFRFGRFSKNLSQKDIKKGEEVYMYDSKENSVNQGASSTLKMKVFNTNGR